MFLGPWRAPLALLKLNGRDTGVGERLKILHRIRPPGCSVLEAGQWDPAVIASGEQSKE